ncbi:MAG: histidine kinase dimerization/phospho-acceptor domain-containing protein [Clostridiaceae bacterium]|nr:cell wall metabolism sensor histidine kinase WalK [Eubacteriales bacterium]
MKKTILVKILGLVLLTVLLSAALTALVFSYSGRMVFSSIKARELAPRAAYIAEITAGYLQGYIGPIEYKRTIETEYAIWDAALYIYDADSEMVVRPQGPSADDTSRTLTESGYVKQVLAGERLYSPDTAKNEGVVIGQPAMSAYGNVIGAVFLVKPLKEVNAAIGGLIYALIASAVLSSAAMMVPAFFASRGLTKPLRQMNSAAQAMARGDFTVRAYEGGKDEVSQLGRSLNLLSSALSKTIGELTFERNRLRAVLDGLGEGIVAINAQREITHCNPSAVRLLGGAPGEDCEALEDFPVVLNELYETLAAGGTRTRELVRKSAVLRVATTALTDEFGAQEGAVALVQDVTEAERLEQTRREYVANVSHELRTPIASIRSLADALNDGLVKKSEDKQRYYGYILKESLRLSRLIDDLLELSRLQSGAVALTKRRFDLAELVYDVADRYKAAAAEKGLNMGLFVPEGTLRAYSNPDRAEQVLIAVLDNAIKHTASGGDIGIHVREDANKYLVSVTNPGDIGEEDAARLFDRFYKVDKSHSGGGTGLGLAIAREVLALLDESISVTCENGVVEFAFTLDARLK